MSKSIKDYWSIAGIVVIIAIVALALLRPWSTPETELTFETSPHQVNIALDGEDLG